MRRSAGFHRWVGLGAIVLLLAALAPSAGAAEAGSAAPATAAPSGSEPAQTTPDQRFAGKFFGGAGDAEYLQLLDIARRMFSADPEYQNLAMLYTPAWNGFVEGPTWGAWWIQNSYGTTYAALPFLAEPWITFLENSHALWFDLMGDGKRAGQGGYVAPDGCLCDAAAPGMIYYRQGDGRVDIHDWGMEFTAAGLLMQAELLLIRRDPAAIARYVPKLERCANFIETRRDPKNDLFLAGPAGNLLAPSFAGWKKPDGTYGMAYLAGLSITYIAALDRLVEVEKLGGREAQAKLYAERRDLARRGLAGLVTPEGYFVKSIDPDGTRHGVYGAERHGYFEASPNHDAIALRVVDDAQAERIYAKIASIPGLRPHDFIIPNYPSLDDMYEAPQGLWAFGTWVNGGHWSTCEARMILAYYRLGRHEDARKSMRALLRFAREFRMDNPLVKFGSDVYQPGEPINLCYDTIGPAAALVRGLFEYLYSAEGVTLVPHVPQGISELDQEFPVHLGRKRIHISSRGTGPVTAVLLNGAPWRLHDATSIRLPEKDLPDEVRVTILLGDARAPTAGGAARAPQAGAPPASAGAGAGVQAGTPAGADPVEERLTRFVRLCGERGLGATYEAAHARLALECFGAVRERQGLLAAGKVLPLADATRAAAAEKAFVDAAARVSAGLAKVLEESAKSEDPARRKLAEAWTAAN